MTDPVREEREGLEIWGEMHSNWIGFRGMMGVVGEEHEEVL